MSALPFHLVTLSHPDWEAARACAQRLGDESLPELRLDLFPDQAPGSLVDQLHRRCLVSCRRVSEGGSWPDADEAERLSRLESALEARPAWVDLEWELPVPEAFRAHRAHSQLLRSVHVPPGVFDLDTRLQALPEGDAFKWVGWAERLSDNARLRPALTWARNHRIALSAFLRGPKGIPSRALQAAWGGSFTYAAPDDGPAAAPGQPSLGELKTWRAARLRPGCGVCGVIGSPVLHSRGPAFHNPRFTRAFKDLVYLPLDAGEAAEAVEALEALELLGVSITAPLKESLPAALGLEGPLNTLWRRTPTEPWQGANTDAEALRQSLSKMAPGTALLLGDGGVATASRKVLEFLGHRVLQASRSRPCAPEAVAAATPSLVLQATSLGMAESDPLPFPELLEAARPSLRHALEWVYKTDTAFAAWAREQGLDLIEGATLFAAQAEAQSRRFIKGCG